MSEGIWPALLARLTPGQRNSVAKLIDLSNPPDFFEYVQSLFPNPGDITPHGRLLLNNSVIAWGVLLSVEPSRSQALELADRLQHLDAFDVRLMHLLGECAEEPGDQSVKMIVGGLDVIDNLGPKPRLLMALIKFLRHPNAKVRSKAAKITGQITSNQDWINRHFAELDPRVRSNVLEALALNPEFGEARLRDVLEQAVRDPHNRVSVTAMYLLARMGDTARLDQLKSLQQDGDPAMQKSAAWAVSQLEALKSSQEGSNETAEVEAKAG